MAFESKSQLIITALLVSFLTVILVWFGSGLKPWWPLLWLAPAARLVVCIA